MKPPFLRTPYNYNMDEISTDTGLSCPEKTLTQQQFAQEADINNIVKNFGITGQLPNKYEAPSYSQFEGIFDYQSALNAVLEAEESFMALDAKLRERFNNDPQELLTFLESPSNLEEARSLGLVNPAPPQNPAPETAQHTTNT